MGRQRPVRILENRRSLAQSHADAEAILQTVLTKGTWFGEIIAIKKNHTPSHCSSLRTWSG